MQAAGRPTVRKLAVANFRAPRLPDDFEARTWADVQAGARALLSPEAALGTAAPPAPVSLQLMYRAAETLCHCRLAGPLHARLAAELASLVPQWAPAVAACVSGPGTLPRLLAVWASFARGARSLANAMLYLDRVYVLGRPELLGVWDTAVLHFREGAMRAAPGLEGSLRAALLQAIEDERSRVLHIVLGALDAGTAVSIAENAASDALIREAWAMLGSLGLQSWVEDDFLAATSAFYARVATSARQHAEGTGFYVRAVRALADAEERAVTHLWALPGAAARAAVERCLAALFVDSLVLPVVGGESGLVSVLAPLIHVNPSAASEVAAPSGHSNEGTTRHASLSGNGRCVASGASGLATREAETLAVVSDLARRTGTHAALVDAWATALRFAAVRAVADALSSASSDPLLHVLALRDRAASLLSGIPGGDAFAAASKDALDAAVNARQTVSPADLVAVHADKVLRGQDAVAGPEPGDDALERAAALFRALRDKDAFEARFKADLAQRLLHGRSASLGAEAAFVARLRAECGGAYTGRMEAMVRDVEASKALSAPFYEAAHGRGRTRSERLSSAAEGVLGRFGATVLSAGLWPPLGHEAQVRGEEPFVLPPAFAEVQAAFASFYEGSHRGRRLAWQSALGTVVLRSSGFADGVARDLLVSVPQALVLAALSGGACSFGELCGRVLSDPENALYSHVVSGAVRSLAGRAGVVRVDGDINGAVTIPSSASVSLNTAFTSRHTRLRLTGRDADYSEFASSETRTPQQMPAPPAPAVASSGDRQHRVDAAIVRALKAAKRIPRAQVPEASGVAHEDVDWRLPVLIEREFVALDASDPRVIVYVP